MGGSISAGADNDEMIDNLIKSRYIRTNVVEKVFRSVDRAFYFLAEFQHTAYRDLAWKQGNLHLSAPCIYSEVLEHLKLEPGHSFLNIGSGTGYLSTLAGLILGPYGSNHGIEIHADVVEYAYEKLEEFKKTCSGVDVFEFCEPIFVVGNAFNLNQDRRYDRIYCGAACPEANQEHIKKFMKVGGILVLPCEDDLLKIIRTSEGTWEVNSVLPVSFSTLQFPDKSVSSMISMPDPEPLRLQEICRSTVRSMLRSLVEAEEPELTQKRKCKQKNSSRKMYPHENCVVIPVFEDVNGVENAFTIQSLRFDNFRPVAFERLIRNLARINDNMYDVDTHPRSDSANDDSDVLANIEQHENEALSNGEEFQVQQKQSDINNPEEELISSSVVRKIDSKDSQCSDLAIKISHNVDRNDTTSVNSSVNCLNDDSDGCYCYNNMCHVVGTSNTDQSCKNGDGRMLDKNSYCSTINANSSDNDCISNKNSEKVEIRDNVNKNDGSGSSDHVGVAQEYNQFETEEQETLTSVENSGKIYMTDLNSAVSNVTNERPHITTVASKSRQIAIKLRKGRFATKIKATKKHCSLVRNDLTDMSWKQALDESEESVGDHQPKKVMKREKLDSGISEESDDGKFSVSNESSFAESTNNNQMEIDSDEDSDFTEDSSYEENSSDPEPTNTKDSNNSISMKYRACMEKKIQSLPLPKAMKLYLNYDRDFLVSFS